MDNYAIYNVPYVLPVLANSRAWIACGNLMGSGLSMVPQTGYGSLGYGPIPQVPPDGSPAWEKFASSGVTRLAVVKGSLATTFGYIERPTPGSTSSPFWKWHLQTPGMGFTSNMVDDFGGVELAMRDVAYVASDGTADFYQSATLGVGPTFTGGSRVQVRVKALGDAVPYSTIQESITLDGTAQSISIRLPVRLHSSQNPAVTVTSPTRQSGYDFGVSCGLTFGSPVPSKNQLGQITEWRVPVTPESRTGGQSALVNVHVRISETITYLGEGVLVSGLHVYYEGTLGPFTVQSVVVTEPVSVTDTSFDLGSGTDAIHGFSDPSHPWLGVLKPLKGGMTTRLTVNSGSAADFTTMMVYIVAKSFVGRVVIGTATPLTGVTTGVSRAGNSIYQQSFVKNFDSYTTLDQWDQWDVGYEVYLASGSKVASDWFGTYSNDNLSHDLSGYKVIISSGSGVFWSFQTSSTVPIQHWTPDVAGYVAGPGHYIESGSPPAPTYTTANVWVCRKWPNVGSGASGGVVGGNTSTPFVLESNLDGAGWVSSPYNHTGEPSVPLTGLTPGAHSLQWRLSIKYTGSVVNNQEQTGTITFTSA